MSDSHHIAMLLISFNYMNKMDFVIHSFIHPQYNYYFQIDSSQVFCITDNSQVGWMTVERQMTRMDDG